MNGIADGPAPAVEVTSLRVSYDETVALDGVNLTVASGQVHGLVGMNGSGKSTLFKSLMGLIDVQTGSMEIFGTPPTKARKALRVAYTPQSEEVDWDFPISVRDVVTMGRYGHMGWRRRTRAEDREAVDHALARCQLQDFADRQIGALSGGQRKRAFVARGLAQGAELLLLDEPFAGVDRRSETMITGLLRELAAEGRTILISTHDLISIPALCDQVALINRHIIAHGNPAETLVPDRLAEAFGGFVPREMLSGEGVPVP